MPRFALYHIPYGLYSVVSKCNNNEFLFDSPHKIELYLQHLLQCKKSFQFTLYDIVCMSNHVHELYRVPERVTIAQILQRVKGIFSQKFNERFCRSGHFWKNKPFYRIIENEQYAYHTMNYFHMNPVKAGLVEQPEQWPYSGYRFHVLGERLGLLGALLSPLSESCESFEPLNQNVQRAVEKCMAGKATRYIGSPSFRDRMRTTRYRSPPKASDAA